MPAALLPVPLGVSSFLSLRMTVHEASRQLTASLTTIYEQREAENITDLLMEHLTSLKKTERRLKKELVLSLQQEARLAEYTDLLLKHRPIQYVINESWFYGMRLYVDESVLIPRPETEELAEWIIKDSSKSNHINILDIGTGSGCIAVALKKNIPEASVSAIDISEKALKVAQKNALDQDVFVQFIQMDILKAPEKNTFPLFTVIVSNPPYIPVTDKTTMQQNVLDYEPHSALFVEDNDPLLFYTAIARFAAQHLQVNGSIYCEIHEAMGEPVKKLFTEKGFSNTVIRKDMQGKDRMIKACRN